MLSLTQETFDSLFPFYIEFERSLTIVRTGPALQKACPSVVVGAPASASVRIRRPFVELRFEAIQEMPRAVFFVEVGTERLLLRGQMIADEAAARLVFLGSPTVSDLGVLTALGLSLDDFALHDAAADYLLLLQSKNATLADAKKLTAELTVQRAELRKANQRLSAQFAVSRVLVEAASVGAAMRDVLAALCDTLGFALGVWWEVEQTVRVLRCAEVWVQPSRSASEMEALDVSLRGFTIAPNAGLPGQVWSRREALWASEVGAMCPIVRRAMEVGLQRAIAFPIVTERDVLGVIGLWSRAGQPEAEEDIRLLMMDSGVKIGQFAERGRAEEALRESEERYALAAHGAKDGLWDWKLTSGRVHYSARWKAMLGYEEHAIQDRLDEWFTRVHPDDRGDVEAELAAHLEGRTESFEVEHRMVHRDGTYRWMLARGIAVRDTEGNALRMAGTQTDVTQRKRAEIALVEAREDLARQLDLAARQQAAIRSLSTPILVVWEGVLAVPVIGALSGARAEQMRERLLAELARTRSRVAVIDMTGAERMDTATASHLLATARAARLLGSRCIIAGVSAALAQAFAALDVELSEVTFAADVKSALAAVVRDRGGGRL